MPTFEQTQRFIKDLRGLDSKSLDRFRKVVLDQFVPDVDAGVFRRTLRVREMRDVEKGRTVYEMSWAFDGRATFEYGEEVKNGVTHVIWRRVGTHSSLNTEPGKHKKQRL